MPPARVVAGARRRAHAPRRVASVVVSGDPARHSPARARHTSALGRRLADANATPLATRASASLATRLATRRPRVVPAAVREPGERGYEPASTSDDAAARDEDDPRAVASGPAGPSPTAARRARDAARAADRYVAEEGDRRGRERTVAETRRTRPRGARPRANRTPSSASSSSSSSASAARTPRTSTVTPRGRKSNRYNRPRLGGAKNAEETSSSASSSSSSADRPKWLSHQHTRRPSQQPQQRRKRGGGGGNGMRPGERIVEAMEALPSDVVAGVAEGDVRGVDDVEDGVASDGGFVSSERGDAGSRYPGADDRDAGDAPASSSDRVRSARRSVHAAVSHISKFSAPTLNFAIKELGERGGFDRAHALYLWMNARQRRRGRREVPPESTHAGESVRRGVRSSPRARRREMLARRDAIRAGRDAHERGCLRRRRGVGSVRELARRVPGVARHGRRGRTA